MKGTLFRSQSQNPLRSDPHLQLSGRCFVPHDTGVSAVTSEGSAESTDPSVSEVGTRLWDFPPLHVPQTSQSLSRTTGSPLCPLRIFTVQQRNQCGCCCNLKKQRTRERGFYCGKVNGKSGEEGRRDQPLGIGAEEERSRERKGREERERDRQRSRENEKNGKWAGPF